jgi:hypothetical protein
VGLEIGHCHHAAGDEGGEARQQPKGDEEPGDQLDVAADHPEGVELHGPGGGWEAKDFLAPMAGKEQAYDQAHDAISGVREAAKRVHGRRLFSGKDDVKIRDVVVAVSAANRRK